MTKNVSFNSDTDFKCPHLQRPNYCLKIQQKCDVSYYHRITCSIREGNYNLQMVTKKRGE